MDTLKHVPDVIFPFFDHEGHRCILIESEAGIVFDRAKLLKRPLVAVVDVVHLIFIDQTLDALVDLLFVGPKVEWHVMFLADISRLLAFLMFIIFVIFTWVLPKGSHCRRQVFGLGARSEVLILIAG